jgi:hypothetical protein
MIERGFMRRLRRRELRRALRGARKKGLEGVVISPWLKRARKRGKGREGGGGA